MIEQLEMNQDDPLDIAYGRKVCTKGLARMLRLSAGLSLRDIANAVGTSEASVSRWERERRGPANARIAAALGRLYRSLLQ